MATPPLSIFLLFALLTWSLADPMTSEATTGDASSTMLAINTTEDTADMIDITALEIATTFDDTAITTITSENATVEMTTSVMTSREVTTTGVDMTTMPATTSTLTTTRTASTTRPTTETRTPDADQNEIVVIRKGEVLVLDCYLEEDNGVREETYWLFDGTRRFNGSRLSIPNLNHTHHGRVIECINKTTVVQRRTIHYHHVNVLAVNETLKLNCTFDPTAATNVQWKHSVNGPKSDWNITNIDNVTSQLIIHEVTLNDTGVYKCLSSQGDVLKVFNISIGFKPRVPNFVCSGCNTYEYRCEWPEVFDTHLPTEVTFEYKNYNLLYPKWYECEIDGNGCDVHTAGDHSLRLTITNDLARVTSYGEYNKFLHARFPAPRIIRIASFTNKLDVYWTLSDCGIHRLTSYGFIFSYENPSTGQIQTITLTSTDDKPNPKVLGSMTSNTKYCISMVAFVKRFGSPRNLGDWSDKVCNRTLPTAPDVILNIAKNYTSVQNEERLDERDVTITWSVNQNKNSEQPFQGISSFKIEVSLDDETQNGTNASVFTYNIDDRYLYLLPEDRFNYTIKGLSKHENYTISVTAVNSNGYSNPQEIKVSAVQEKSVKISGGLVAGLCILVIFLIMALLAFGFQRLKNNSKPMPAPVYHGNLGNIQPTTIENEVFDELPSVLKESQRRLLMSMSIESEDSQLEDKGYRTSSTSSSASRGGTYPPGTHSGMVEKVPLLEIPCISGNTDKNHPYSVLSQLMPSRPPIQMAPDAVETDLDSLSPVGGHYSFSEEGLSLGGSSDYNQLESTRDTSFPNPYYAMVGMVPVRIADSPRDSGYASVRIRKCSSVGCDDCADDEISQPPTPALPNCSYFYSLSDRSKSAGQHPSLAHSDPCTGLPMSENLTTIVEGPDHYVLPSGSESKSPDACNSGYVAHDDVFLGKPAITQHESCNNDDPSSSSQSSPEHAVIIHPKPLENIKSPHECIDDEFVSDLTNAPLNIGSGPSSAAIDNLVSCGARSNSKTPSDNGFVDCPPTSASPRIRPNGNTGYVTAEELTPLQMSSAAGDTHQSKQPMQNPTVETVRRVPSLNGNFGYVQAEQLLPLKLSSAAEDTHRPNQPLQNPIGRTVLPTPFQNASGYVGLPISRKNPSGYISVDDLSSTNLGL